MASTNVRHSTSKTFITLAAIGLSVALGSWTLEARTQSPTEQQVTVLKRDGNRIAGQLEAIGRDTLYVRVSTADQQRIPVGDVLVVDFVADARGLPETETGDARGGEHLVVMRDSSKVKGQLVETKGGKGSGEDNAPRVLIFQQSGGGQTQIPAERVGRLYLGNFPANSSASASSPAPAAAAPAGAIRVAGNQDWTPTGIRVRNGQRVRFTTTGQVVLSDAADDIAGPAGSLQARKSPNAPLTENYAGCLIARVGNSKPFAIGDISTPISMPADGELVLGINDDHTGDNKGEFFVQLGR